MASWLPYITNRVQRAFKRRAPPLHRALGDNPDSEAAVDLLVDKLATKRRVRRRDAFQRNALHVAVRTRCSVCVCFAVCVCVCAFVV